MNISVQVNCLSSARPGTVSKHILKTKHISGENPKVQTIADINAIYVWEKCTLPLRFLNACARQVPFCLLTGPFEIFDLISIPSMNMEISIMMKY